MKWNLVKKSNILHLNTTKSSIFYRLHKHVYVETTRFAHSGSKEDFVIYPRDKGLHEIFFQKHGMHKCIFLQM